MLSAPEEPTGIEEEGRRPNAVIFPSVEFAARRGLFGADSARHNLRAKIIFSANRSARHPSKHGELPEVRDGVGDGALKQLLGGRFQALTGSQIRV